MSGHGDNPVGALVGRFAGPYLPEIGLGLGLILASLFAQRVPALLVGVALDGILLDSAAYSLPLVPATLIPEDTMGQLWFTVGVIGAATVVESGCQLLGRLAYGRVTLRALHDLRTATYDTVIGLDLAFFDRRERGDVMSVLNNDVNNLTALSDAVRSGVLYAGRLLMAFVFMLALNWQLSLVVAVLPVLMLLCSRAYAGRLQERYEAVRESVGDVNTRIRDAVSGIATVKAMTMERIQRDRVAAVSRRYKERNWSTIRIDGRDLRAVSTASLRAEIGYVSQDPFLFTGTVRENVAFGASDPDDAAVERAAREAGAHEFVTALPEGYDTVVGEGGVDLSGGQRQRLVVARAIVSDPSILVFDEATSHVDTETEALIQSNLRTLTADRTTFVVAHRLSTVRNADRILVLRDGRIVEQGDHESLLEADGEYATLWNVQVGKA